MPTMGDDTTNWLLLGLGAGLGANQQQNRFDGYVHAFMAQGYPIEAAQAAARQALGIRPPGRVHYGFWALVGFGFAAFWLLALTFIGSGAGAGGATVVAVILIIIGALVGLRNLLLAIR